MAKSRGGFSSGAKRLKYGASIIVLSMLGTGVVSPVSAQDEEADVDTVVVTGMRRSLQSAQQIKRNADTIVDSITEADIGSFPDKSVAEALQRVAGITVNRFAAPTDTAHFSAEPSGVIVRGLQQVRSEFNGRDTFSANSSRGLSWGDVSPELMSGVDTYKNQTAELIEGGIAGTVNLRTRVPFDQSGQLIAISANANWGDLSKEITPEASALYSNRWETGIGELGFLANYAYSNVKTRSGGAQLYRMNRFRDVYFDGLAYIPASLAYRENDYDRTRHGVAMAAQWRDNSDRLLFTAQFNRSQYDNAWEEYVVSATMADLSFGQSVFFEVGPGNPAAPQPLAGTPDFTFDSNGLFQSGVMTQDIGWWGADDGSETHLIAANASGMHLVNACYGWNDCEPARRGGDMGTATRSNNNRNVTRDLGFNLKWTPSDDLRFNFDFQKVDAKVSNYDIEVGMNSYANAAVDLSGKYPTLALSDPLNVNLSPGELANPNNYRHHFIMDHVEKSKGDEIAVRGDVEWEVGSSWLHSVKMGMRYADRDQVVRWSTYNWSNVANTWAQNACYYNVDSHAPGDCNGQAFLGYPMGAYEVRSFASPFGGALLSPQDFVFFNMGLMQDQQAMARAFSAAALGFSGDVGWNAICSNRGSRVDEIPGSCFKPAEIADVSEASKAGYIQFNYGGPDALLFGVPVSGNIGVRYVETTVVSSGGIAHARIPAQDLVCEPNDPGPGQPPPPVPNTVGCYLSADDIAFASGGDDLDSSRARHKNWLPSFNMKLDLSDEWVFRFAASRAMSRPDIGNLRNYLGVSQRLPSVMNANDPLWVKDSNGDIVGANVFYSASAQNPRLKPVLATQFDVSLEWYFAEVGSLSFALFHKTFDDYIQFDTFYRNVTNNGVTRQVEVRGPLNGEGASIRGFEAAYISFFDFLPDPFDGFGVQANYTFIDNRGITNPNISNTGDDPSTGDDGFAPDRVSVNALEGLSKHAYNVIGMYEKGGVAVRLAYNWRSKYMVTAVDCCVALPIWNQAAGFLDGSVRYRVSDNVEVSFSGSNLLNTKTVLRQQVENAEDGGLTLPNAWFENDRRLVLGVRLKL